MPSIDSTGQSRQHVNLIIQKEEVSPVDSLHKRETPADIISHYREWWACYVQTILTIAVCVRESWLLAMGFFAITIASSLLAFCLGNIAVSRWRNQGNRGLLFLSTILIGLGFATLLIPWGHWLARLILAAILLNGVVGQIRERRGWRHL